MAGKQRYTRDQVQKALVDCNGLLYMAAKKLGCTSGTVINYMHRYPTIKEVVDERRGERVDIGEAQLDKAVLAGEAWAVQFLLKTQGKDRGYVEKSEQDIKHSGGMEFSWDGVAGEVDSAMPNAVEERLKTYLPGQNGTNGKHE